MLLSVNILKIQHLDLHILGQRQRKQHTIWERAINKLGFNSLGNIKV